MGGIHPTLTQVPPRPQVVPGAWLYKITNCNFLAKFGGLLAGCKTSRSSTNDNDVIVKVVRSSLNSCHQFVITVQLQSIITSSNMVTIYEHVRNCPLTSF